MSRSVEKNRLCSPERYMCSDLIAWPAVMVLVLGLFNLRHSHGAYHGECPVAHVRTSECWLMCPCVVLSAIQLEPAKR